MAGTEKDAQILEEKSDNWKWCNRAQDHRNVAWKRSLDMTRSELLLKVGLQPTPGQVSQGFV